MLKKLLSFTLIFTLATQVTFGSPPELTISSPAAKKQQAKNLKKKIIIAAVVATVAAAGSALAVANFAPEYYPKVLKKYTPTWLLTKEAHTFFEQGESVHDLETNEPSTDTTVNEQELQPEDFETLIGTLQPSLKLPVQICNFVATLTVSLKTHFHIKRLYKNIQIINQILHHP
jgi:hypothetical protein